MALKERYPLHACIWRDEPKKLQELLQKIPKNFDQSSPGGVNEFDNHGNAPIHLCLILGRKACLSTLLRYGEPDCRLQSRDGWSPLAESVSLGDRDVIRDVLKKRLEQTSSNLKKQVPEMFKELEKLMDFRMEMHWHFTSWIPFVANLCPSDTNTIYKRKSSLRLDTTIAGFDKMRWVRGNLSMLLPGKEETSQMSVSGMKAFLDRHGISYADCFEKLDLTRKVERVVERLHTKEGILYMLNNDKKVYVTVSDEPQSQDEVEKMINMMMSTDRTFTQFDKSALEYKRAKTGYIWQSDRTEVIAGYEAKVWDISGITIVSKIRSEHLTQTTPSSQEVARTGEDDDQDAFEDAVENQDEAALTDPSQSAMSDETANTKMQAAMDEMKELQKFKASLPPPPPPTITATDYFDSNVTGYDTHPEGMGRPLKVKLSKRTFKGKVWCCDNFPLKRDDLLSVLKPLAPSSVIVQKIVEFLQLDLPPGFPVRLEVPIFSVVTVQITFQNFVQDQNISADLFSLSSYTETNKLM